jgi:hypothetical protein
MLSSLALSWRRKLNHPYGSEKKSIIRAGGADGTVARGEAPQRGAQPREVEWNISSPEGAADYVNTKDIVLPPLPGLLNAVFL